MALRLRRGTDAERLTITPLEGELIYTTDTEELFIGDGTTVGGNPVITNELADLSDVDLSGLADGQTIVYNLSNSRFEPGTVSTAIDDLTDVDTTGIVAGNILKWNGAAFIPGNEGAITEGATYNINIDGDLTGSVFGDDSTTLVDGVSGQIVAPINTTEQSFMEGLVLGTQTSNPGFTYYSTATNGLFPLAVFNISNVHDDNITNEMGLFRARGTIDAQTTVQAGDTLGSLTWAGHDGAVPQVAGCIKSEVNSVSTNNISADVIIATRDGLIGTYTEVMRFKADNGSVAQGYVQFGSLTTAERDALTATNGMVIYNTTNNKFEGYQNGAWINLDDGLAAS